MAEAGGLQIPETPKDAITALGTLNKQAASIQEMVDRFRALRKALNEMVSTLYEGV